MQKSPNKVFFFFFQTQKHSKLINFHWSTIRNEMKKSTWLEKTNLVEWSPETQKSDFYRTQIRHKHSKIVSIYPQTKLREKKKSSRPQTENLIRRPANKVIFIEHKTD